MALKGFYEGVEENAKEVLPAQNYIQELYYASKNKSHMLWDEFEIMLTNEFVIVDKDAGRQIHTDESKLCLINKKLRSEFLANVKITIEIQMSATPMTMTYSYALAN